MKLSTRVRYGVRAMIQLAASQQESPVLLDSIANRQGISRKYLDAIFARLKAGGLVTSSRGAGGGFLLARPASDISLADIYKSLEGPVILVDCSAEENPCGKREECPAMEIWCNLSTMIDEYLSSVMLDWLVEKKREMERHGATMFYI